jgi:hypothetical protein
VVDVRRLTFSEYSTTSLMFLGYPETRYVLAAGAIFISNISTSVTVLLDSCPKSFISVYKQEEFMLGELIKLTVL